MAAPLLMEFDDPLDGQLAAASRPEAVRIVVKDPLEERTEELANHLLSNAVAHGGDAQRTGFAVAFGNVDSA
jgi:hypothetical protein